MNDTQDTSIIGKDRSEEVAQKVLIAYHAHCIDGFTSAWACWRGLIETTDILAENIELMEMKYGTLGEVCDKAHLYDKIYFVDFSVPLEELFALTAVSYVVVIDHHKTAIEMYEVTALPGGVELVLDINECGASLVWKYFFGLRKPPTLIEYVKDYDLWRFELGGTKPINKFLRLQDKTLAHWDFLARKFPSNQIDVYIMEGQAMLDYHDSIVAELVANAQKCEIEGERGLCVNCSPQFSSDVGHELALLSDNYGATWQQEEDGQVKWSLRSNDIVDVAALAAKFGGGGHRNAAGFYLKAPSDNPLELGVTLWAT